MHPVPVFLRTCIDKGLLVPSPFDGIFWTPSIGSKVKTAYRSRGHDPVLDLGEFLISDYSTLATTKAVVEDLSPGSWTGTEIHHIVENFHLQFLGGAQPVNEHTYKHEEPCVLMSPAHHKLHVDNIVGKAESLVMESLLDGRPRFDFVQAFLAENPGISKKNRTEQGAARAAWVRAEATRVPARVTRREIRATLLDLYRQAYRGTELRPLRWIAEAVLESMP